LKTKAQLEAEISRLSRELAAAKAAAKARPVPDAWEDRIYYFFGHAIHAARIGMDMRQEDLASYVGMSRTSIANLEAGNQRCPVHQWEYVADHVGLTLLDLAKAADAGEKKFLAGRAK
jgi:ribosome-binding protein aMBF1 (putative translation factor)